MIKPLTSLRFFAAMMVLAHHYWGFEQGYVGVGFFYVLSGYVLAYNYADRVRSPEGRRDFWFRRFARIYPTHVLTWAFALPLAPSLLVTLPALPLVQAWIPVGGIFLAGNGPSWSISDEAFFYAVFPLLLGIRWKTLALWGTGLVALAMLWPNPEPVLTHGARVDPGYFVFYIFPLVRLFEFALGIALCRLRGGAGWRAELGAVGLAVASLAAIPHLPAPFNWAIGFVPASATMVYVFSVSSGPVSRMISNRWLVLLGDASFMLYMIHWPLGMYVGHSALVALFAVSISVALYVGFERPIQNALLRFRSGRVLLFHASRRLGL